MSWVWINSLSHMVSVERTPREKVKPAASISPDRKADTSTV